MRLVRLSLVAVGGILALGSWAGAASPGATERVSLDSGGNEANSQSLGPAISADGRFVAFNSGASNLVPGDTNDSIDTFVHDRLTAETVRVSVTSQGEQGKGQPAAALIDTAISDDGRIVAFNPSSALVPEDSNKDVDVYVHSLVTGETELVSLDEAGNQFTSESLVSDISGDGRVAAFSNEGSLYMRDLEANVTERIAPGGLGSPSEDGRYIAFVSSDSGLVTGDTNGRRDIFVYDRQTGEMERVSVASDGTEGNGASDWPSISNDGRYVAFGSDASNCGPMICRVTRRRSA